MAATKLYDVLVIGGGPAGLSVAVGLARQLIRAVVFDSGVYRNARATHMHNVLGFDHVPPAEFRAKARSDLRSRYDTVSFVDEAVLSVQPIADERKLFRARLASGQEYFGRRVVIATGVHDVMEDIAGYSDCWARGIFHCLFCHGYEERGAESVGVLAAGLMTAPRFLMHGVHMAQRLAAKVTIYTNGSDTIAQEAGPMVEREPGISVDTRPIASLQMTGHGSEIAVTFASGEQAKEGFIANAPKVALNGPFVEQLKLDLGDNGEVKVAAPFQETSVPGVFAAGDISTMFRAIPIAAAQGAMCAAGLVGSLAAEPSPTAEEFQEILSLVSSV